ncbi:hypothetical protein [Halorubrum sp. 48-1-W]|uniref:hypothetical protein n=1 Tax=Halorubrum sp. 48-1-W TaxID=2249761 RepID=UPI0018E50393|nr:hypothetical protein [Halorubrum sp. 48-1-W]
MVNEQYEPDATEEAVIAVLREERRLNAPLVVERTDLERAVVNHALRDLATAGWCRKVARGLYEFVEDPRQEPSMTTTEAPDPADGPEGAAGTARLLLQEWDPADVDSDKARQATVAVVAWLAAQDGPQQKADVLAWADEQGDAVTSGYAPSTLWDKVVQPGLSQLVDEGLLSHRRNVGYAIVDE